MTALPLVLILWTAALGSQPQIDPTGTWRAVFTGPMGDRPKMVSVMTFDLQVNGSQVTGMAHMSNWPGDAPITEGKLEGDRISFTVHGKLPWSSKSPRVALTGYPKLVFTGTLRGNEIDLSLNWGGIVSGTEDGRELRDVERRGERDLPMAAVKLP